MANHDKKFDEWIRKANTFVSHTIVWNNSATTGAYTVAFKDKKWDPLFIGDLPQLASELGIFTQMYPSTDAVPVLKEAQPEPLPFPQIEYYEMDDTWYLVVLGKNVIIDPALAGRLLNAGIPFKP